MNLQLFRMLQNAFNRTIVELKLLYMTKLNPLVTAFNRTIVELKLMMQYRWGVGI